MRLSTLVILTGWTTLIGCVSPNPSRPLSSTPNSASKRPAAIAKAGKKVLAPEPRPNQRAPQDLRLLFDQVTNLSLPLSDDSIRVATSLHPSAPTSLEEAILVTTQLRLLKDQVDQSSTSQARDLYESKNSPSSPNGASLETLFQNLQIDLILAYKTNTHLKNEASVSLGRELLDKTHNRPEFASLLRTTLDEENQRLVAAKVGTVPPTAPASAPDSPSVPPTVAAVAPEAVAPAGEAPAGELHQVPSGEVRTGPTDLKRTDALMMQAQRMADKGDFKQAIDSVARIEAQDPFFEQAREKIRIYSNRAVQDLRQKAAQAFQNALPLNDSQAKQAYLVQAKALLEKALQDYPSAEQLDTVKENLAVIARDLETIAKDTVPDGAPKSQ